MNAQSMRFAVSTGACTGTRAIHAKRLVSRGYDLPVALNRERLDDLAKRLAAETRRRVEILAADLANANDLAGVERIVREDPGITLLANNAGMASTASLLNSDVAT